jgi:ABC-2 type transport system ATP-binding protein
MVICTSTRPKPQKGVRPAFPAPPDFPLDEFQPVGIFLDGMIEVRDLCKTFGAKRAVDGISFSVRKGEVLGFLGPNGAGKSTAMRMVAGFLPPTGGSVRIDGVDPVSDPVAAKSRIGYLPENAPSYADMDVGGFLTFMARLRGLRGEAVDAAVDAAVAACFLAPVRLQSIETLSKGYRHRVCLAQAIIHDPEILILDEPTDGLDPNQKHEVRSLIRRMGESKAILFSTHILEEVGAACTRAVILDRGKIVAGGTPEELKGRSKLAGRIDLRLAGPCDPAGALKGLAGVAEVEPLGAGAFGILPGESAEPRAVARAVAALAAREGWPLEELRIREGRLDDVFREITSGDAAA